MARACYQWAHAVRLLHDADASCRAPTSARPSRPISHQVEHLDRLGFHEAWIGEHFTAEWENIPAPDIFIGAALQRTRTIKLGTGVSCLPNHNPFHLAHRIAMLDQLAQGRFLWGIGSGGFPGDFEVVGIDPRTGVQRQVSVDTVDAVLAIWDDPRPGDYAQHGWTYHVPAYEPRIAKHVHLKPFQQPHPPIAVAGVTEKSETLGLAGERGWIPMSINFVTPRVLRSHWASVTEGAARSRPHGGPRRVAHLPRRARRAHRRAGARRSARRRRSGATTATTSCRCSAMTRGLGGLKMDEDDARFGVHARVPVRQRLDRRQPANRRSTRFARCTPPWAASAAC